MAIRISGIRSRGNRSPTGLRWPRCSGAAGMMVCHDRFLHRSSFFGSGPQWGLGETVHTKCTRGGPSPYAPTGSVAPLGTNQNPCGWTIQGSFHATLFRHATTSSRKTDGVSVGVPRCMSSAATAPSSMAGIVHTSWWPPRTHGQASVVGQKFSVAHLWLAIPAALRQPESRGFREGLILRSCARWARGCPCCKPCPQRSPGQPENTRAGRRR